MVGPLVFTLALFAPAPPAGGSPVAPEPPTEPAVVVERDYEGPTALEPPTAKEVEVRGATAEPTSAPSGPTSSIDPDTAIEKTDPTWLAPKRRETPRVLATIEGYGYPEDEIAVVGKKRVKFNPGVQVRNQVGFVSPFPLDRPTSMRPSNEYSEGGFSNGRIRWNPTLSVRKKLKIVGQLDLASGRWAPQGSEDPVIDRIIEFGTPPVPAKLKIADPRELYLEYRMSFGLLRIGQQAFTWGQGMLANSGNYVDRFGDMRFGDDSRGDIYERVLFATKPFQYRTGAIKDLAIAIGGDLVFRDERVDLTKKDLAGQALLVLRWQPEKRPGDWIGGYAVYRKQKNADDNDVYPDDNTLEVGAVDVSGQGTRWIHDKLQLIGAFESAIIFGRTDAARDVNGKHKVLQGGGVVRGYVGNHETWLVGLDAGYASGDPNPNDRWINNFVFDAGHTAGMVLFQQVQGWRTAQSEILATDGEITGEPLNGTQFLPTRGGVTNAVYIHPKARYALWERLEFWGGPLIAAAPVPIVDPVATRTVGGGVPTNHVGGDGGRRYYGTEIDIGIRGRFDIRNFWLMAGLQGGLLLPGAGLANAANNTGGPVGAVFFRTEIRY